MKAAPLIAAVASLATTVVSFPLQERADQVEDGLIDYIINNLPAGYTCPANTRCSVKGQAVLKSPPGSDEKSPRYTYSYDTYPDGSSMVTITFEDGGSCTYNMEAETKADAKDEPNADAKGDAKDDAKDEPNADAKVDMKAADVKAIGRDLQKIIVDAANKCLAEKKAPS